MMVEEVMVHFRCFFLADLLCWDFVFSYYGMMNGWGV